MLQENKKPKLFWWILTAFLLVPLIVSVVSTIHVITFFELTNHKELALTLAIAFEIGALSALAGLVALNKINKNVVIFIFILLTLYQMMGNVFFAFDFMSKEMLTNPNLIKDWVEMFGFSSDPEDVISAKRIIAIISGAILPIISLSFLDLSVDYIQKSTNLELTKPITGTVKKSDVEIQPETIVENPKVENSEINNVNPEIIEEKENINNLSTDIIEIDKEKDDIVEEDFTEEDFESMLESKKKRFKELKEPYLKLLFILYKGGEISVNEELPSYKEFINLIPKDEFSKNEIMNFLTICNFKNIFRVSNTLKIALKSYEEAVEILKDYLKWN